MVDHSNSMPKYSQPQRDFQGTWSAGSACLRRFADPTNIRITTATTHEGASHSAPWGYTSVGICNLHFPVFDAQFISFITSEVLKPDRGATSTAPGVYNAKSDPLSETGSAPALGCRVPRPRGTLCPGQRKLFGLRLSFDFRDSDLGLPLVPPFIIDASRHAFRIAPTLL